MLKKWFAVILLGAVLVALLFGAVNRTLASSQAAGYEAGGQQGGYGRGAGQGLGRSGQQAGTTGIGPAAAHAIVLEQLPPGELNQAETEALLYLREEEKLARDVYAFLYQQWGTPVFANIQASEQVHMDAMLGLLQRYDLSDPASATAGVFTNPDLQALYTQLTAQGSQSLTEAYRVGAAIEEIDILDLQKRLAETDQEDVRQVFTSLMNGSYNHLSAFSNNYARQSGETYQPQYLSAEQYQQAAGSGQGMGGNGGANGGRGRGGPGRP